MPIYLRWYSPFKIGKARVSPLNYVSIPRLELIAAAQSVTSAFLLQEELDIEINSKYFGLSQR